MSSEPPVADLARVVPPSSVRADANSAGAFAAVGLDADDTLWHTESAYAATYDRLVDMLLPYIQHADEPRAATMERLEATERANLAVFGYGAKAFVLSMIETAIALSEEKVALADISALIEWGKGLVTRPVDLLDGVRESLGRLAAAPERPQLWLLTKGDLFEQEDKIARSGLADLFDFVEIMHVKTESSYRELLQRRGVDSGSFVMVGNSLASDVRPVLDAGGYAVHVPYHLTWALEMADEPTGHPRFAACSSLAEATTLVLGGAAAFGRD